MQLIEVYVPQSVDVVALQHLRQQVLAVSVGDFVAGSVDEDSPRSYD
jgi:hypothetical protein